MSETTESRISREQMIESLSDWPELDLEMISGLKIEPNILGLRENCRVERILNLKKNY